jgi:hypothetical protein
MLTVDQGFCWLTGISGNFNNTNQKAFVTLFTNVSPAVWGIGVIHNWSDPSITAMGTCIPWSQLNNNKSRWLWWGWWLSVNPGYTLTAQIPNLPANTFCQIGGIQGPYSNGVIGEVQGVSGLSLPFSGNVPAGYEYLENFTDYTANPGLATVWGNCVNMSSSGLTGQIIQLPYGLAQIADSNHICALTEVTSPGESLSVALLQDVYGNWWSQNYNSIETATCIPIPQ